MCSITPEINAHLQDIFNSVATRNVVAYHDIPKLFSCLGFKLTKKQMANILKQIVLNRDRNLQFIDFLSYMHYISKPKCQKQQLLEAFKSFDRDGTGLIHVADLRNIFMSGRNNQKQEREFQAIIKSLNVNGGEMSYSLFIDRLYQ